MKRILLRALPFAASVAVGLGAYALASGTTPPLSDLLIGLSSALFAIPLLFLGYQAVANFSSRKLRKDILYFFRLQIDASILGLINQLSKIVYSYDRREFDFSGISKFLNLSQQDIKNLITNNRYLGFQLFKSWREDEDKLSMVLMNSNALSVLEEKMTISIIEILRCIRSFEHYVLDQTLYEQEDLESRNYKVTSGVALNPENARYPYRKLLLKEISPGEAQVCDFGDFHGVDDSDLLKYFRVKRNELERFAHSIHVFCIDLKKWVTLNSNEIVIDDRVFRPILPTDKQGRK